MLAPRIGPIPLHRTQSEEGQHAADLRRRGMKRAEQAARTLVLLTEGATILTPIHGDRAYVGAATEVARAALGLKD